jgi:hypothetical protein
LWERGNGFDPEIHVEAPFVDKVEVLDAELKEKFRACENQRKTRTLSRIRRHIRSDASGLSLNLDV